MTLQELTFTETQCQALFKMFYVNRFFHSAHRPMS